MWPALRHPKMLQQALATDTPSELSTMDNDIDLWPIVRDVLLGAAEHGQRGSHGGAARDPTKFGG